MSSLAEKCIALMAALAVLGSSEGQQCYNMPPIPTSERATDISVRNIVYVKVLRKFDFSDLGETYSVEVEWICTPKHENGYIPDLYFNVLNMGKPRAFNCPSRTVHVGEIYFLFLDRPATQDDQGRWNHELVEFNDQTAVFLDNDQSWTDLDAYVGHCLEEAKCSNKPEGWKPYSIEDRAEGAEVIVKALIKSVHYFSSTNDNLFGAVCELKCQMKRPHNMLPLPKSFNVTALGKNAGICAEHHVDPGVEYVMYLQRNIPHWPLPGATIPPHMLENYVLGPHEVNWQAAIFNATDEVLYQLRDYPCSAQLALSHRLAVLLFTAVSIFFTTGRYF